ncbi:MAG: toll/interleukin-1 receptor domain-containing protein [Verrucomicrobia bacterium]|nr:toll/interleukin-1 receptor domain-containing protein [Verrucomicrobiota bacterium]
MPEDLFLSDRDWRNLLRDIHNRQVVPIVGAELVKVGPPDDSRRLVDSLAAPLAHALGLTPDPARHITLNRVACDYLLAGHPRKAIYEELRELISPTDAPLSAPLGELAAITDFDLFITTTFDPLIVRALEKSRPGFRPKHFWEHNQPGEPNVLENHYSSPVDLPAAFNGPLVYYAFGSHNTYPDFAVWEEDYLEYICGLLLHQEQLKHLFLTLRSRYLLFLGAPFTDWAVRFFLRVAKGERFSDRKARAQQDYLADQLANLGEPMIFFFDKVVGAVRIIPGDPGAFVCELARRWREKYASNVGDDLVAQMPDDMPQRAVFISYAKDDLEAVRHLVRGLRAAQIPYWFDKQRLEVGQNYERSLEQAVRVGCSFFLSVISHATESDASRYVHKERAWAAQRHCEGFAFYLPVIIDDTKPEQVKLEPAEFATIERVSLPGGDVTVPFAKRLRRLVEEFRISGAPRV